MSCRNSRLSRKRNPRADAMLWTFGKRSEVMTEFPCRIAGAVVIVTTKAGGTIAGTVATSCGEWLEIAGHDGRILADDVEEVRLA